MHISSFYAIMSLSGSSILAKFKFWTEYSWPQNANVSSGNDIIVLSEDNNSEAVPPSNLPQPAVNRVSPQNKKGVFVESGVT
jgi:hypothetical protein